MTANNANIFLASVVVASNKAVLWGDSNFCSTPFEKFRLLSISLDYALLQYDQDPDRYGPVVKALNSKLDILRFDCKDICNHKLQLQ